MERNFGNRKRLLIEYLTVGVGIALSGFLSSQIGLASAYAILLSVLYICPCVRPGLRPGSDEGLWVVLMLPYAVCLGGKFSHTNTYSLSQIISSQTLLLSLAYIYNFSFLVSITITFAWTSYLVSALTPFGIFHGALISITTIAIFHYAIHNLYKFSPRSFSLGELLMVVQALTTFFSISIVCFVCILFCYKHGDECPLTVTKTTGFLQAGLTGCALFVVSLITFTGLHRPAQFYLAMLVSAGFLVYPLCAVMVKGEPVQWLIFYCSENINRLMLMCTWVTLVVFSVLFIWWYTSKYATSSTIVRKVFHILVIVVFYPGVIIDSCLLYLACGAIVGVFAVLEIVRILKIPPFGIAIHDAFSLFLDEKDAGQFILTHIYLLIGCALPLWLYPSKFEPESYAIVLSGLVALGFGDTAASFIGSLVGKHHWPGTKKTYEGTVAAIGSQLCAMLPLVLQYFNLININTLYLLIIFVVTSSLEAITLQIDNLVLPAFTYVLMLSLMSPYIEKKTVVT